MSKTWEININTPKLKKNFKTSDLYWSKKLIRELKRKYKADEIYMSNGTFILHKITVVGKWKVKRLDGVKI